MKVSCTTVVGVKGPEELAGVDLMFSSHCLGCTIAGFQNVQNRPE